MQGEEEEEEGEEEAVCAEMGNLVTGHPSTFHLIYTPSAVLCYGCWAGWLFPGFPMAASLALVLGRKPEADDSKLCVPGDASHAAKAVLVYNITRYFLGNGGVRGPLKQE